MSKYVLVTGSSRGIGREVAIYLAKNGFDIVLHCNSNLQKAQETAEEIKNLGQNARILQFDTSKREQCKEILTKDIEENGCYYGVVLNAGISRDNVFPAMEPGSSTPRPRITWTTTMPKASPARASMVL